MQGAISSRRSGAPDSVASLLIVLVLGLPLQAAAPGPTEETPSLFKRANAAMNAGRYPEAQGLLDRLIQDDPGFYQSYPRRWEVLGKLRSPETVKIEIRKDLALLEKVPPRKRNDDLYFALMEAKCPCG